MMTEEEKRKVARLNGLVTELQMKCENYLIDGKCAPFITGVIHALDCPEQRAIQRGIDILLRD